MTHWFGYGYCAHCNDAPAEMIHIGFSKHNGCGELVFRQAGHPANDVQLVEDGWQPIYAKFSSAESASREALDPDGAGYVAGALCSAEERDNLLDERARLLAATGGLAPTIVVKAMSLVQGSATAIRPRDGIFTLTEKKAIQEAQFEVLP